MGIDSKVIRANNVDKLESLIDSFLKEKVMKDGKETKELVVKSVTAISSHDMSGDHVVIMIYDKNDK